MSIWVADVDAVYRECLEQGLEVKVALLPATTALMTLVALLTAMPGVPLLTARVNGPPDPVLKVQLCLVAGYRSSKTSVPV